MSMLKRARRRITVRKHPEKRRRVIPETWTEIHGHKLSPHAASRYLERISSDDSLVDVVLKLGHVIEHPEHIKPGKGGRAVFDDGQYKLVLSRKDQKVIATVMAMKS